MALTEKDGFEPMMYQRTGRPNGDLAQGTKRKRTTPGNAAADAGREVSDNVANPAVNEPVNDASDDNSPAPGDDKKENKKEMRHRGEPVYAIIKPTNIRIGEADLTTYILEDKRHK